MRRETIREFLEAVERGCQLLNEATGQKATGDYVLSMGVRIAWAIGKMPARHVNAANRGGAVALLRSFPEPNEEEKARLISFARELPFIFRKPLTELAKNMLRLAPNQCKYAADTHVDILLSDSAQPG
jgi:hypothetical protein